MAQFIVVVDYETSGWARIDVEAESENEAARKARGVLHNRLESTSMLVVKPIPDHITTTASEITPKD